MPQFRLVAVGGTFDEFHKGHRALIRKAFESGESVWIGLCTDRFAKKLRKDHEIATYDKRKEELRDFLRKEGFLERAEIVPLSDPFGPAAREKNLDAIVVSRETEPRAQELNKIREKKRLLPLEIVAIDLIPSENHIPISTTRIRRKEIDREGFLLRK